MNDGISNKVVVYDPFALLRGAGAMAQTLTVHRAGEEWVARDFTGST